MSRVAEAEVAIAAEPADSPAALALVAQLDAYLDTLYAREQCHRLATDEMMLPNTRFLVARRAGEAAGCGAVRLMEVDGERYGEIKRMYVAPAARGLGIGRRLLERLEEEARSMGVVLARLETGVGNVEAKALYERSGYRAIAPFGEYTDNGVSLCYEKRIA